MRSAVLEVAVAVEHRSPSPVVPGAWPLGPPTNSLHQRSSTFPSHRSSLPTNLLHLDHVRHFQRRLSRTLFNSVEYSNVAAARSVENLGSSDLASTPSDGSAMTRFTQLGPNISLSIFGDTTVDTSCSSPAKSTIAFPNHDDRQDHIQHSSINNESRIYDASSDSISQVFPSTSGLPLSIQDVSRPPRAPIVYSTSLSCSSWPSEPQSTPEPVSPISFSSPTSSNNALPPRSSYLGQVCCPSLEYSASPSWETSFGSHIGGFDPSRAESDLLLVRPLRMLNPSQSQPSNTFGIQDNTESSAELDISTIPMLTTLSLPGSLDTSLNISRRSSLGHAHRTRTVYPLDLDNSHTQNSSLSSSSPHVSDANGITDMHVLEFPSPPLSLSPFITAPPPDWPIIQMIPSGADSSTVEYASAVVSSAWGADISVRPDYPIVNLRPRTLSSSAAEIHQELEPRPSQEHAGRTVATIMSRIKTLGRKMKKFVSVSQKTKTERSNVEKEIGESGGAPVLGTQAAFLAEDSFVSIEEGNCQLPLPPGLESRKVRLGVPPEPYTSESAHRNLTSPPLVNITSSSCSYRTSGSIVSNDITATHAPENNTRTLEIEARPKTLAEIKSKRRLSLSILSGASRSVSQPNSSIVAVARTRSRPRSTVMLPVTRSSSIADEDMDNGDNGSNSVPNPGEDNLFSAMTPAPDTLPASLAAGTSAANKKKYRRFSLSALSHLVKSA